MNDFKCDLCDTKLTWRAWNFSMSHFKKGLCIEHQKEERLKTMPKKMAEFLNNEVDKFSQGKRTGEGGIEKAVVTGS